jgi:hypothetical protein
MLTLTEAAINGVLFADASEEGLLGGWLEAFVLAMANIGAAFLLGRLIFTQLHRRGPLARASASAASLCGIAVIVAINLFGAHYRDYKAQFATMAKPAAIQQTPAQAATPLPAEAAPQKLSRLKSGNAPARSDSAPAQPVQVAADKEKPDPRGRERDAIASILRSPLQIESFASVFLLVIGLCGATIAAWDGYRLDDPYPGYGRRHRRYMQARARKSEALNRVLSQCGALMGGNTQAIARKIEDYAQEVAALQALHQTYAGERKALQAALDGHVRRAEEEMECQRRILCKWSTRTDEYFALTAEVLPELNEKHAKFYETQERKLKALQKLALKEQDEILSMFEEAAGEFHKLLAETAQESLRLACMTKSSQIEG